jgi:hypothetical protein
MQYSDITPWARLAIAVVGKGLDGAENDVTHCVT